MWIALGALSWEINLFPTTATLRSGQVTTATLRGVQDTTATLRSVQVPTATLRSVQATAPHKCTGFSSTVVPAGDGGSDGKVLGMFKQVRCA